MKKIVLSVIVIAATGFILSSCSKCYECTTEHEVEVVTPDTSYITTETSTEDYCTADESEIQQKEEDEGATCVAS